MTTNNTEGNKFWGAAKKWHIVAWSTLVFGILFYTVTIFGVILDFFKFPKMSTFIAVMIFSEFIILGGVALFFFRDKKQYEQNKVIKTLKTN